MVMDSQHRAEKYAKRAVTLERVRREKAQQRDDKPAHPTIGRGKKKAPLPISNPKLTRMLTGKKTVKRIMSDQNGRLRRKVSGASDPGEHELNEENLVFTQHEGMDDQIYREDRMDEKDGDAAVEEKAWADSKFMLAKEEVIESFDKDESEYRVEGEYRFEGEYQVEGEGDNKGEEVYMCEEAYMCEEGYKSEEECKGEEFKGEEFKGEEFKGEEFNGEVEDTM